MCSFEAFMPSIPCDVKFACASASNATHSHFVSVSLLSVIQYISHSHHHCRPHYRARGWNVAELWACVICLHGVLVSFSGFFSVSVRLSFAMPSTVVVFFQLCRQTKFTLIRNVFALIHHKTLPHYNLSSGCIVRESMPLPLSLSSVVVMARRLLRHVYLTMSWTLFVYAFFSP